METKNYMSIVIIVLLIVLIILSSIIISKVTVKPPTETTIKEIVQHYFQLFGQKVDQLMSANNNAVTPTTIKITESKR